MMYDLTHKRIKLALLLDTEPRINLQHNFELVDNQLLKYVSKHLSIDCDVTIIILLYKSYQLDVYGKGIVKASFLRYMALETAVELWVGWTNVRSCIVMKTCPIKYWM